MFTPGLNHLMLLGLVRIGHFRSNAIPVYAVSSVRALNNNVVLCKLSDLTPTSCWLVGVVYSHCSF